MVYSCGSEDKAVKLLKLRDRSKYTPCYGLLLEKEVIICEGLVVMDVKTLLEIIPFLYGTYK